jgi:hypothetical protein
VRHPNGPSCSKLTTEASNDVALFPSLWVKGTLKERDALQVRRIAQITRLLELACVVEVDIAGFPVSDFA